MRIGSGDTYKKLDEPGLVLQDKLAAHYAMPTERCIFHPIM
jgi:hypothetical protein